MSLTVLNVAEGFLRRVAGVLRHRCVMWFLNMIKALRYTDVDVDVDVTQILPN